MKLAKLTVFHCATLPNFSIDEYVNRIITHCELKKFEVEFAGILLRRYLTYNHKELDYASDYYKKMEHRLVLVTLCISRKYSTSRYCYGPKYWSKVGGVRTGELMDMELEFLFKINFELHSDEFLNCVEMYEKDDDSQRK